MTALHTVHTDGFKAACEWFRVDATAIGKIAQNLTPGSAGGTTSMGTPLPPPPAAAPSLSPKGPASGGPTMPLAPKAQPTL